MIELTKEELIDLLENLEQRYSEGYIQLGDPAFIAMRKILEEFERIKY